MSGACVFFEPIRHDKWTVGEDTKMDSAFKRLEGWWGKTSKPLVLDHGCLSHALNNKPGPA